jgi:type III pantothenate kinase
MSAPSPAALLTADLGNSRCKLRLWSAAPGAPALQRAADLAVGERLLAEVGGWLGASAAPTHAALSTVGDPALSERLRAALSAAVAGEALTPPHGLELEVREAHTVGQDRLFAARGALRRAGGAALVVDAGTALTVDALDVDPRGRGVFRGGAIAPGPQLCAEALARRGARLVSIQPRPGARALGRSTPEALEAGVVVGFRGAARELVRAVGEDSGLAAAPLVLTGGARGFLLEPPLFERRALLVVEDLVHLGLLEALLEHLGADCPPGPWGP